VLNQTKKLFSAFKQMHQNSNREKKIS